MIANKQAIITKEHDKDMETIILYKDMKTYGKDFYEFYLRAKDNGVKHVKGKLAEVYEDPKSKNLHVTYEDLDTGKIEVVEVELLVLSVPLHPSAKNKRLSKVLKIELDPTTGFFKEQDSLEAPLRSNEPGVFLCGGALGPADISEAVTQAIAASIEAVSKVNENQRKINGAIHNG